MTLLTVYSLRFRAGSFSRQQRSWDFPFGAFSSDEASGSVSARKTHLPFFSASFSRRQSGGPARRTAASGFYLVGVPCGRRVISAVDRWMLPWVFSLPGLVSENLDRDFAQSPLTRLANSAPKEPEPLTPQSLDQPSPSLAVRGS